jgi:hypothetical protein
VTTHLFTNSAYNGGDKCTIKPTVINACTGTCTTTSTEIGQCENGSALTTYHVNRKGKDRLGCEPAVVTGECGDISSQEKLAIPGIMGWLMLVLF